MSNFPSENTDQLALATPDVNGYAKAVHVSSGGAPGVYVQFYNADDSAVLANPIFVGAGEMPSVAITADRVAVSYYSNTDLTVKFYNRSTGAFIDEVTHNSQAKRITNNLHANGANFLLFIEILSTDIGEQVVKAIEYNNAGVEQGRSLDLTYIQGASPQLQANPTTNGFLSTQVLRSGGDTQYDAININSSRAKTNPEGASNPEYLTGLVASETTQFNNYCAFLRSDGYGLLTIVDGGTLTIVLQPPTGKANVSPATIHTGSGIQYVSAVGYGSNQVAVLLGTSTGVELLRFDSSNSLLGSTTVATNAGVTDVDITVVDGRLEVNYCDNGGPCEDLHYGFDGVLIPDSTTTSTTEADTSTPANTTTTTEAITDGTTTPSDTTTSSNSSPNSGDISLLTTTSAGELNTNTSASSTPMLDISGTTNAADTATSTPMIGDDTTQRYSPGEIDMMPGNTNTAALLAATLIPGGLLLLLVFFAAVWYAKRNKKTEGYRPRHRDGDEAQASRHAAGPANDTEMRVLSANVTNEAPRTPEPPGRQAPTRENPHTAVTAAVSATDTSPKKKKKQKSGKQSPNKHRSNRSTSSTPTDTLNGRRLFATDTTAAADNTLPSHSYANLDAVRREAANTAGNGGYGMIPGGEKKSSSTSGLAAANAGIYASPSQAKITYETLRPTDVTYSDLADVQRPITYSSLGPAPE